VCGILGLSGPGAEPLARGAVADLAHRGPDGDGLWSSPELALGHRRLAIIGLDEGGRQPMQGPAGTWIVFNGEIYNYLEIADRLEAAGRPADRRYDTAILLSALETWGREVLPELDGMFAFAWYRPAERRLLLARDRWGKKPLFWGQIPVQGRTRLVFSSELRTFRDLPGGPPDPDPLGVARYLVYDGMPGSRTVYRGVSKVPAATWLELEPEGLEIARGAYWSPPSREQRRWSADEATEAVDEALQRSLTLRLRSDVPIGLFLSGGLDSSLLADTWRRLRPDGPIHTFTVGFDDPSYDERASARLMADAIGSEHHELVVSGADLERELDAVWSHLSEPFADPSIVPVSLLCRFARERVTVALGGDGGDELQAGYDPFRAWTPARVLESVLPRRFWATSFAGLERILPADPRNMSTRFKARHFAQGFRHPPAERIQAWLASFPPESALAALRPELARAVDPDEILAPTREAFAGGAGGGLAAQTRVWLATYLECSILAKVDRASMMHSLEVRAPFLDPALADLLLSLPPRLVFRRGRGKVLLRRLAARRLPRPLLRKPKKGLGVPQARWLRTVLRDRMEEALTRSAEGHGWFRPGPIRALWEDHLSGRADYRRPLWNFLFSFPFQA
jgi:asparagine synthase (glutamine-hydrolysing)